MGHLQALVKKPREHGTRGTDDEFELFYLREYSASDLDAARLLRARPVKRADSAVADHPIPYVHTDQVVFSHSRLHGRKQLADADENSKPNIFAINTSGVVVTKGFRDAIHEGGLVGAKFEPIVVEARQGNYEAPGLWSLRSERILPRLSPRCHLVDRDGNPFTGDYSKACVLVEDRYYTPECHYQAGDLDAMEPFDVALTHESFGAHPTAYRDLVYSQRFRALCLEHGIKMEWWPVRIDP